MEWKNGYFFPLALFLAVAGGLSHHYGAIELQHIFYTFSFISFITWMFREES